jgi:hypothetical protein
MNVPVRLMSCQTSHAPWQPSKSPAFSKLQEDTLQTLSPCDVAALKKCLDENKGDHKKVLQHACPDSGQGSLLVVNSWQLRVYEAPCTPAQAYRVRPGCQVFFTQLGHTLVLLQCLAEVQAFQIACSKPKQATETFSSK